MIIQDWLKTFWTFWCGRGGVYIIRGWHYHPTSPTWASQKKHSNSLDLMLLAPQNQWTLSISINPEAFLSRKPMSLTFFFHRFKVQGTRASLRKPTIWPCPGPSRQEACFEHDWLTTWAGWRIFSVGVFLLFSLRSNAAACTKVPSQHHQTVLNNHSLFRKITTESFEPPKS